MALFKIKRGLAENLPTNSVEGYCYVTTDDSKFYIDIASAATASSASRICLNAAVADSLADTLAVGAGGTGKTSWTKFGVIYASGTNVLEQVTNNTSTTKKFLRMTGTGSAGTAPVWDTVTKSDVGLSNVENTALSTWAGSANITTLGTIATGTWNASTIGVGKGGTGKTSWTKFGVVYASDTSSLA